MPRTNVGKTVSKMTRKERDEMIVRCAFARMGIYSQSDMARAIGAGDSTISKAFKDGLSPRMIFRMHAVVDFTPEEREELLWNRL